MPSFVLPIIPTAQARARHSSSGGFSRTYKAKSQVENEDTIKTFLLPHVPEKPMTGAVSLYFIAYMPIPKSASKKWKETAKTENVFHTKKPDLDNLAKNLKDCMTHMRFWCDDKQVSYMKCSKVYSENPRWEVEYRECKE